MPTARRPTSLGVDISDYAYRHFNQATPDADCLQICHPNPPAPPDIQSSTPALDIQSLEDVRQATHPTGLLEGRTEHKSHPDFNKPPMACFPRYKRVRFVEKPETKQYSCSPLEKTDSLGNVQFRRSQEPARWQSPQSLFSLLDNHMHPKASKTCLPYACFKRKPNVKDEAIWKCGQNLRENITAGTRGTPTTRNSSFTKMLRSVADRLRADRPFVQRLKGNSGHPNSRTVSQSESESEGGFSSQREVKATNNYDLNLAFSLSQSQMDSVYVADSQLDEGFVDSSGPLGGYMYPESPVRGDEWEGYERPSKFWMADEDSDSNLYEPVRGRSVCPTYMRPDRLARLNFPDDYYGDTSGCESCDLSPLEPPEMQDLLEQPTFVKSPVGTPSRPNAYGAQPHSRPLEPCPDQPSIVSKTVPDVSPEQQTTDCSPSPGEAQCKPSMENRIVGSLARLSLPDWAKRFLQKDTHSVIESNTNRSGSSEDQKTSSPSISVLPEKTDITVSFPPRKSYLPRFPRFLAGSECTELASFDEQHIYYERIAINAF